MRKRANLILFQAMVPVFQRKGGLLVEELQKLAGTGSKRFYSSCLINLIFHKFYYILYNIK